MVFVLMVNMRTMFLWRCFMYEFDQKKFKASLTPELCCSDTKVSLVFYQEVLGFNIQYMLRFAQHLGKRKVAYLIKLG